MIQTTRLSNGIRVITDVNPTAETVSLGCWVGVGARYETPDMNGISHVLEHMAFKGTQHRSAFQISREIEDVGGIINAYTGKDVTAYYVKVLKDDMRLGLDIIADIVQYATMDQAELEKEKGVIIQEINMSNDTPDELVFDHLAHIAYPDQPLGRTILGTPETVRSITSDKLLAYVHSQYAAERMVVSASGAFDAKNFVELCETLLTHVSTVSVSQPMPAAYRGGDSRVQKQHEQVNLVLAFEGTSYFDPDYFAARILAAVLGGGMSSRLFQEIREKRGLVYTISAFNSSESDTGLFSIYAGTGEKEVQELMPVLCDTLLDLPDSVTEEEIARAQAQYKARLLMQTENISTHAERHALDMITRGRIIPSEELVAAIEAVDKAALKRVAHRLFSGVPSFATLGPIAHVMPYDVLCERLKHA